MALFDGDMVSVTTPDGRQITVPSGLAVQFPGLRSTPPEVAQPPALPVAHPPPTFTPEDQADLAQRTAPPPDTAIAAPVTAPSQVAPSGPQAPRGPVSAPAQASDAGPPNAPGAVTNDQLAKMGVAGGVNAEIAANDAQRAATQRQGAALADQAEKVGAQMHDSEQEAHRLLEERRQVAEANARDMQTRTDSYLREAKAIADTKIDRSVDHPILAAIGVALGGIGAAMQHKDGNPALDALYKAIDRKVAGQVQDLDQKRQGLATQRDALGMQRQAGMDRLQEMDTYRLGYLEQAKRQVETIKQQTTSNVVRANADVALAGLQGEAAKTVSGAQARWQTHQDAETARKQAAQQHRESLGMQYQIHKETMDAHERESIDARAAQVLAIQAKKGEERAKDVRERGVWNPATGEFMLTPEGQKRLADADAIEAQIRKDPTGPAQAYARKLKQEATTPEAAAQADQLAAQIASDPKVAARVARSYSESIREEGKSLVELAPDAERSRKAGDANAASHAIYQKLADLRGALGGDLSAWDREKWAGIKTELGAVANEYASTLKERVSPKAMEAFIDHIAGFDSDSIVSRVASKGKILESIEQLEKFVKTNSDAQLKSLGIRGGWQPSAAIETSAEQTFRGKTAAEIGSDAAPGLLTDTAVGLQEAGKALAHPLDAASTGSNIGRRNVALEAENAAVGSGIGPKYGLDPKDEENARALIEQANSAGDAKRRQIIDTLAQPIIDDKRPGLSGGITGVLRDVDPRLLAEVLMRVNATDPKRAAELIQFERARRQLPTGPLALPPVTERAIGLPWKGGQ